VVLVDAPASLADGRCFGALRQPALAMVLTHAAALNAEGLRVGVTGRSAVPVLGTFEVRRSSSERCGVSAGQSDLPAGGRASELCPTFRVVRDGETVSLGGTEFTAYDCDVAGPEGGALWLLENEGLAFIGNLAYSHVHPDLANGRTAAWLRQLERGAALLTNGYTLYPRHGAPAGRELLDRQRHYIRFYRA
jgi:glyoxylase-like metal-dependent hydrolase (beta-lactamase superfamily II)